MQEMFTTLSPYPLFAILVGSLVGSPHCAAMCGGFVALSSEGGSSLHRFLYHLGRLTTYLVLGGIAGTVGASISDIGTHFGISNLALLGSALILILWGILLLIPALSPRFVHGRTMQLLGLPLRKALSIRKTTAPVLFAFLLGAVTTLLPCGWLYVYVALAASSGDAVRGGLVMIFFWVGTLPILLFLGRVTTLIQSRWGQKFPLIKASVLILAGTLSLVAHLSLHSSCHTGGDTHVAREHEGHHH